MRQPITPFFTLFLFILGTEELVTQAKIRQEAPMPLDIFLRSMQPIDRYFSIRDGQNASILQGLTHYRVLPGWFPKGMAYHFDGLATALKINFVNSTHIHVLSRRFGSQASKSYDRCDFFGTGTGPTKPWTPRICFQNPGVNVLPFNGTLWLTIDTVAWGRIDPYTLEAIPAKVETVAQTLNAHPACDHETEECFVQHPCTRSPVGRKVCFSKLKGGNAHENRGSQSSFDQKGMDSSEVVQAGVHMNKSAGKESSANKAYTNFRNLFRWPWNRQSSATDANLKLDTFASANLENRVLLQHSHSPCITENFLVSKLDRFAFRNPLNKNTGLLRIAKQEMSNEWLITPRPRAASGIAENLTRILKSNYSFVNNHFINCYEGHFNAVSAKTPKITGKPAKNHMNADFIVVDLVGATDMYLDNYFQRTLSEPTAEWDNIFTPAKRCKVPLSIAAGQEILCENLLVDDDGLLFDYPTFNPLWKTKASSRYFYAAGANRSSRWFDRIIKVDSKARKVTNVWIKDDTYVTEPSFIPDVRNAIESEEAGWLLSIVHTQGSKSSQLLILDASDFAIVGLYDLGEVIPFHAHGVSCLPEKDLQIGVSVASRRCFANP